MSTRDSYEIEVDDEEKSLYKLNIDAEPEFSKQKPQTFWEKYGEKIILVVGIFLIAGVSFEAGYLKGQKNQKDPIEINQAACAPCPDEFSEKKESENEPTKNNPENSAANKNTTTSATENQKCALVASKNSDKYHLASCQWAEKIKTENRLCFSSAEEAQGRGYQPAKCCIK